MPGELLHHLGHQPLLAIPGHRDAAEPAHEDTERAAEELRLADEVDLQAQREDHSHPDDEIPAGGMRRDNHHQLGPIGEPALDPPADQAEQGPPEPPGQTTPPPRQGRRE